MTTPSNTPDPIDPTETDATDVCIVSLHIGSVGWGKTGAATVRVRLGDGVDGTSGSSGAAQ